ncbi:MAG: hypothetical protein ACF8R9_15930 [Phycisphaerales bacterium JB054]
MSNQTPGRSTGSSNSRNRARVLLLSAGCVGLIWLAGCGRDADEQSVSDASIMLAAMDNGSGTPSPEASAKAGYNEVINSLQSIASGDGPHAADAAVLVSEAQQGIAVQATERAADLLHTAQLRQSSIRAQLRAWQMHNAAADAAASYDAAPEIAAIDRSTREKQDQAEAEQARKATIEADIAGLLRQVTDRLAQASDLRAQAGNLRLEIARVSETEGLRLTEQIRELSRAADKLEFEAREIKVRADRRNLDLQESEVEITKLTNQIVLLGQSRTAVQTRATAAQEQAARARGDAQKAAVEIAARVDSGENALTPFMESQASAAMQEAISGFKSAIASANKAKTTRKSAANLAIGQAQQNLADIQWSYAQSLDSYAQLMAELASAQPALPAAAEYASRAQTARQQATEAKQASYDGYQAAKSAYAASGASGDARDRLNAVGSRLDEISAIVGKGVVDAAALESLTAPDDDAATDSDESAAPADTSADASGDPVADLRLTLEEIMQALSEGRLTDAERFVVPAGDTEAAVLGAMRPVFGASVRLDQASQAAFGQTFSQWSATDPQAQAAAASSMPSFAPPAAEMAEIDVNTLDIRVQGDQGVLLTGNSDIPQINFRREGGEWKLIFEMSMLGEQMPAGADPAEVVGQMAPMMQGIGTVLEQAVAKVESGELKSNQAVAAWMNTQIMQVFMQMMQEQGGG